MKTKINLGLRILFGLMLLAFGLNKFLGFMPPPELTEEAGAFMGALAQTGYMLPMIGIVEALAGLALLSGLFVPLMLVILAPVSVNIVLLHAVLDPANIVPAIVVAALNLYFLLLNKQAFSSVLKAK